MDWKLELVVVPVRDIDNSAVLVCQSERLRELRSGRDARAIADALAKLADAARSGSGNLLELSIVAMRARATVGEVSEALESVWGRHQARNQRVTGVYTGSFADAAQWEGLRLRVREFAAKTGRQPRLLMAKLGQDGHDRGAHVVATAFADLGFDVNIGPLFQTPAECARQAIENDVHAVGVSTLAAGHMTLVPQLINELRRQGAGDTAVFVGGIVPEQDHGFLRAAGVCGIFGPGTPVPESAGAVLDWIGRVR